MDINKMDAKINTILLALAANSGRYGVAMDGYAPYDTCRGRAGDAGNRNQASCLFVTLRAG